jgi:hypothetical protein
MIESQLRFKYLIIKLISYFKFGVAIYVNIISKPTNRGYKNKMGKGTKLI